MRTATLGLALAAAMTIAGPARADYNLGFDFTNGAQGVLGATETFSAVGAGNSAYSVTASGMDSSGKPVDLYVKSAGHGESGLGLNNDPTGEHEITPGSYVQLNFSSLKSLIGTGQLTFNVSSVQSNEGFVLYGSNSAAVPTSANSAVLWTANNTTNHDALYTNTFDPGVLSKYKYFDLTAVGPNGMCGAPPNILLGEMTIKAVPEPGSIALMGMGLAGLFGVAWRRRHQHRTA